MCLLFMQSALRNFRPLLDRVLVQRLAPETVSGQFLAWRHVAMATNLLQKKTTDQSALMRIAQIARTDQCYHQLQFALHLAANNFSLHVKFCSWWMLTAKYLTSVENKDRSVDPREGSGEGEWSHSSCYWSRRERQGEWLVSDCARTVTSVSLFLGWQDCSYGCQSGWQGSSSGVWWHKTHFWGGGTLGEGTRNCILKDYNRVAILCQHRGSTIENISSRYSQTNRQITITLVERNYIIFSRELGCPRFRLP